MIIASLVLCFSPVGKAIKGDPSLVVYYPSSGGDIHSSDLEMNKWYHVAATYADGQGGRLYLNGVLDKENPAPKGAFKAAAKSLGIGGETKALGSGGPVTKDEIVEAMKSVATAVEPYGKLAITWGSLKRQTRLP